MKRCLALLFAGLFCFVALAYAAEVRKLGSNDLEWATPNQGAATTTVSPGGKTVTKIDAAQIPWRNAAGYLDCVVNGSYAIDLKPGNVIGDNTDRIYGFTFGAAGNTDNAVFGNLNITSFTATDNIVNGADLVDDTVTSAKIKDATIAAADIADNTVTPAKLNSSSGTASSSTFYRGDGAWGAPSDYNLPYVYRNLVVKTVTDNQNVDIDADYVVLAETDLDMYRASSVNLTVDLASSGANGLDTGSLAANTGYFLYVIYNGTTVAGLASASATTPSMPSGYTYKSLVSWVTTDNTGTPFNIEEFTQIDDVYTWTVIQKPVNDGGSTTTASIDLSATGTLGYAIVPPTITKGVFGGTIANTSNHMLFIDEATFGNSQATDGTSNVTVQISLTAGFIGQWCLGAITEAQTIYYQVAANTSDVWINGFTVKR